eukprot:8510782-Alexandrium_andersonii.AAC.1
MCIRDRFSEELASGVRGHACARLMRATRARAHERGHAQAQPGDSGVRGHDCASSAFAHAHRKHGAG